jgi:hypothetical protein
MPKLKCDREGDEFYLWLDDKCVSLVLKQVRERGDGLWAEIEAFDRRDDPVCSGNLDLLSITGRAALAAKLEARSDMEVDWAWFLDQACLQVVTEFRRGETSIDLATVPDKGAPPALLSRFSLPEGETSTIFGDGGTGKSYLAQLIAAAVATGHELPWGDVPSRCGPVLYLDWETTEEDLGWRVTSIVRGWGDSPPEGTIHYRRQVRSLVPDMRRVAELTQELKAVLVVVDSLGAACGGDPRDPDVALRVYEALRQLKGVTRLVLTHLSKGGAEGTLRPTPYGSVYVRNESRSVWEIRRSSAKADGNTLRLGLYHQKANSGPLCRPLALRFEWPADGGTVRVTARDVPESGNLAAKPTVAHRIRHILRHGAMSVVEIAGELDARQDTVYHALRRMPDVQQIPTVVHGKGHPSMWALRPSEIWSQPSTITLTI